MGRVLAAVVGGSLIAYGSLQSQTASAYAITDVRVHLFYSTNATFSETLVGNPRIRALWNTPIGEGDAGAPSDATLVVVEVSGQPGSFAEGRAVELAVREKNKETFRHSQRLGVLSSQGHSYVAFWLYDTECSPLRISAALLGQRSSSRRVIDVPFQCGE